MASNSARKRAKLANDGLKITNSIDLSMDHIFFVEHIYTNHIFLTTLLSDWLTNRSFTNLYQRSNLIGWIEVFHELLQSLKSDDNKSKFKQLTLYRIINEYSNNPIIFNSNVEQINDLIQTQLSSSLTSTYSWLNYFRTITDVYTEIQSWRQLLWARRLFQKEYSDRWNLVILQDSLTKYFLQLVQSCDISFDALQQLFNHCMIIVGQPSGTDGLPVTKYEKVGQNFVAKIRTRIICLLNPNQVENYLKFLNINVELYLKDRNIDPTCDTQKELSWKKQIIQCTETEQRTFLYFEYNGNDVLQLTKRTLGDKPLYNNQLCKLQFQVQFLLLKYDLNIWVTSTSEIFGLCSHGKYYGRYLAKVFLDVIRENFQNIEFNNCINMLVGYINELHKRITGVEAKHHTQIFIQEELNKIYQAYSMSSEMSMPFKIDIYENILDELITQMKFMASHPFLAMMYTDNLFLGISGSEVDQDMKNQFGNRARLLIRFARLSEQEKPDNPSILVVGCSSNNNIWRSHISHNNLADDILTLICIAARIEYHQIDIYHKEIILPFTNFQLYYHSDLHCDFSVQTNNSVNIIPLNTLLKNIVTHHDALSPTIMNQSNTAAVVNLYLQHTGSEDLTLDLINFIQMHFSQWCQSKNVQGSLTHQ